VCCGKNKIEYQRLERDRLLVRLARKIGMKEAPRKKKVVLEG